MIKLIGSAIEQSHFVSMLARRTGIKEEILWQDLKKAIVSKPEVGFSPEKTELESSGKTQREKIEERLVEIKLWQKELPKSAPENLVLKKEETELMDNLSRLLSRDNLNKLLSELSRAEASKDSKSITSLTLMIQKVHGQMRALEEKKKIL